MFSVVIPLYNKGHTIVEAVQSVLRQDFEDFEVVIVDDGSTDDGPEQVRRSFGDQRIKLIRQEHRGVSAARNNGVLSARRDFIAFLDADDILLPSYLSIMRSAAEEFPDARLYCSGGVTSHPDGAGYLRHSSQFRETGRVRFFTNPYFFAHSSSMVTRKSDLHRVGGFPTDLTVNEDLVVQQKLALSGDVVFCPQVLSIYRKGITGQVSASGLCPYPDVVKRINLVYAYWNGFHPSQRNGDFVNFAVYDLKLNLLAALKQRDYRSIHYLLDEVDQTLVQRLGSAQIASLKAPRLRSIAAAQIYASKAGQRLKRYPRPKYQENVGIHGAVP